MSLTGPVTSLRISTTDGSVQEGSGNPVGARAEEGTSQFGYSEADLQGVQAYNTYDEFIRDTQDPKYKGDWQDPRPAEVYREACAKRLAKFEMAKAARAEASTPSDPAAQIVSLNPGMPIEIAQAALRLGGYLNSEAQVEGQREAAKRGGNNAQLIHEARVTLSYLLGK